MKRICIYGCSEMLGGTEKYILTLYKALNKEEIQFDFLYPYNIGDIPYKKEIEEQGGKIYKEYYKHSDRKKKGAISPDELFEKHPEWVGMYINWQSVDTAYRLIIAAKKHSCKYRIVHAHNNNYNRKFYLKDKIYEKYFRLTKRLYITDQLACSNLAGRWLFKNNNFKVIPDAVEFDKFKYSEEKRSQIREELHIKNSEMVIGFCGRLVEQKNINFLLDIFQVMQKKRDNIKLLIVGDGVLRKNFEKKIEEYNLKKKVILVGAVNNVEDYKQAMDCFILPSLFEGFGIVLLEAQAAGLKCFASKYVVPRETNVTGNVTFLDLKDGPKCWAECILGEEIKRYDAMQKLKQSPYEIQNTVKLIEKIFK